ncbi:hypothetical protein E3N88_46175 [Mikania micrantha]|uniref:Cytochrome P450 n=1 Tax=Mikania micrantha TaxID=192012 RepID=A0A5N6L6Z3_9ASTR|nr:hypothetical protein E3N88_46175 [Mikania micrantha]
MEAISMSLSVVWMVVVTVMVNLWWFFNWVWLRPKRMEKGLREQGLAGNRYRFLFGDLKEVAQMTEQAKLQPVKLSESIVPRVIPFYYKSANIYGSTFFTWVGPRPMVHIIDPVMIRQIFANYNQFQKMRVGNPLSKMLTKGVVDAAEGDQWMKHRKIINPAFHIEKLKIISTSISIVKGYSLYMIAMDTNDFCLTKRNRRMKAIDQEVKSLIKKIINKQLTTKENGESSKEDLLGVLLDSNDKEIKLQGYTTFGLSIDEIIEECKLFYFGGQETTANLLVWTMILLGQHTNWQDRARDEVLNVFGDKNLNTDGLSHLKIINMILHEVVRLYPLGPVIKRMIHEETKVENLTLPPGTLLLLHLMLIHYDANLWGDDVNEFNPERFAKGASKAAKEPSSYFPFGGGPRVCVGRTFALLEAKAALVMILRRFSFKLSPSYLHAPHTFITLQPQFGAQLIMSEL